MNIITSKYLKLSVFAVLILALIPAAQADISSSNTLNINATQAITLSNGTRTLGIFLNTTSGNVGIGTTGPGYPLEVYKSQDASTYIRVDNPNAVGTSVISGVYMGTGTGAGAVAVGGASQTDASLADRLYLATDSTLQGITLNAAGSQDIRMFTNTLERIRIDGTGNVGIGTANPSDKLNVAGNIIINSTGSANGTISYNSSDLRLQGTGVNFTNTTFTVNVTFRNIVNNVGYSHRLGIFVNESERLSIDSTGQVGIGTTNPTKTLDVVGSFNVSGGISCGTLTGGSDTDYCVDTGASAGSDNTTQNDLITANNNTLTNLKANLTTFNNFTAPWNWFRNITVDYINATQDLYIGGVAVFGRANSDNTTQANNISTTNTRIGNLETKQSADNTTIAGNLTTTNTRIGNLETKQSGDNTTLYALLGQKLNLTGGTLSGLLTINGNPSNVGNLSLSVNNTLYVNQSTSNVGIGTANPGYKAQVNGVLGFITPGTTNRRAITPTNWGYSADWKALMIGSNSTTYNVDDGAVTLSFGYDPIINPDSSFAGDGREIIFRRGQQFVTPNSTNNGWFLTNLVLLDGNVGIGTTSPSAGLQINTSNPTLRTNGSVFIDGNVGIGTTSPSAKLEISRTNTANNISLNVNNTLYVNNSLSGFVGIGVANPSAALEISRTDSGSEGTILFNTTAANFESGVKMSARAGGAQRGLYSLIARNGGYLSFEENGSTKMVIRDSNVGIGTTGPDTLLHVGDATTKVTIGKTYTGVGTWSGTRPAVVLNDGTVRASLQTVSGLFVIGTETAHQMKFDTNGVTKMVINSDGNVGIGTAVPSDKLNVAGNIIINATGTANGTISYNSSDLRLQGTGVNFTNTTFTVNVTLRNIVNNAGFTHRLGIFVNESERLSIDSTGQVGIGTASPTKTLDVVGSFNVSGGISCGTLTGGSDSDYCVDTGASAGSDNTTQNDLITANNNTLTNLKANLTTFNNFTGVWNWFANVTADMVNVTTGLFSGGVNYITRINSNNQTIADNLSTTNTRIGNLESKQASDNTTIAGNLTTTNTRIGNLETKQSSDNTTIAGNLTTTNTRIGNLETKQSADNTTIAGNLTTTNARIGNLESKQASDNTTIAGNLSTTNTRIGNLETKQTGDNTTLTALLGQKLNLTGGTLSGKLNISGTDTTNNISFVVNNTLYVNISLDRVGIGTSSPSSKLDVSGTLTVEGINVTGRQIADNTTVAGNLTSTNTRIGNLETKQSADNTTIAGNLTSTNTRIGNLESKEASDNTTQAALLGQKINITGGDFSGAVTIGGGFGAGGTTLQTNGDILMNGTLFITGNITNVDVQTLIVNGSITPAFDAVFDIGSASHRFVTGYFSNDVNISGIYIKARQSADNTTISNRITSENTTIAANLSSLGTRVGNLESKQTSDNTTIAGNLSTTNTRIGNLESKQSSDNTTIAGNLTTTNTRIGNLESKQTSDNTTIANNLSTTNTRIGNLETKQTGDNTTLTALLGQKLNLTGGILSGRLSIMGADVANISLNVSNSLYVNHSSGKVGIGLADPRERLTLSDGTILQRINGTPLTVGHVDLGTTNIQAVFVVGKYAYVGFGSRTGDDFVILDVSVLNATNMSSFNISKVGGVDVSGDVNTIFVAGKYAYVGSSYNIVNEFKIIDISNNTMPVEVGGYEIGSGLVGSIYVSGKYAYVGRTDSALDVVDISDPTAPTVAGRYNTAAGVNSVFVVGRYAYIGMSNLTSGNEFEIVDISNPTNLASISSLDIGARVASVYVLGKYAYVGAFNANDDFHIIDISNVTNPSKIGGLDLGSDVSAVSVSGKYAYFTVGNSAADRFSIVDISNPLSPVKVGGDTYTDNDGAGAVFVSGKYAYVGYRSNSAARDFKIFSISGIDSPTASIGAISADFLNVANDAIVTNNLYVGKGLAVGSGGILSQGPVSLISAGNNRSTNAFDIRNSGGTSLLFVRDDGNVGIGTTSPGYLLTVNGSSTAFAVFNTSNGARVLTVDAAKGFVGVGATTPGSTLEYKFHVIDTVTGDYVAYIRNLATDTSAKGLLVDIDQNGVNNVALNVTSGLYVYGNGSIYVPALGTTGSLTTLRVRGNNELATPSSSRRFKTNITELEVNTSKVYDLRPVSFNMINETRRSFGFIAEEVVEILPEIVEFDPQNQPRYVGYEVLGVLLLNEMQKQHKVLVVDNETGRVGIGTSTPQEKLDVNGSVSADNYSASETGYAEKFEKLNAGEIIEAGDIVVVINGKVTKPESLGNRTASLYLVAVESAGFVGGKCKDNCVTALMTGTAGVKVIGKVSEGDYVLADGSSGYAESKGGVSFEEYKTKVIGVALEGKADGEGKINVAVGVK